MERCFRKIFFFFALLLAYGQNYASAEASSIGQPGLQNVLAHPSALVKIGYGCGWDYPCPPRPDYGRVRTQVNIKNNYGDVNVYADGYSEVRPRYGPPPCAAYPCEAPDEIDIDEPPPYEPSVYQPAYAPCGGSSCEDSCGPNCWYRRFKDGYCGPGCEFYRQKVHFVPRLRKIVVPKPVTYREGPSSPSSFYKESAPPPPVVERRHRSYGHEGHQEAPLRHYEGPQYPPK